MYEIRIIIISEYTMNNNLKRLIEEVESREKQGMPLKDAIQISIPTILGIVGYIILGDLIHGLYAYIVFGQKIYWIRELIAFPFIIALAYIGYKYVSPRLYYVTLIYFVYFGIRAVFALGGDLYNYYTLDIYFIDRKDIINFAVWGSISILILYYLLKNKKQNQEDSSSNRELDK
jgi:hypothetical protein